MSALSVRAATARDVSVLTDFVLACAKESEGASPDAATVARGVVEALADPKHRPYYIAEWEGKPVGCCLMTSEWSDWTARWYWWFQSVYVVPQRRGRPWDVWRRMYAFVAEEARASGVEKLLLYVHEDNLRAQRAYAAVGMEWGDHVIFEAKI